MRKGFYQTSRTANLLLLVVLAVIVLSGQVNKEPEKIGEVITRVNVTKKVVAITFDDGPYPGYTEQILDILDRYKIKGTFFMIGDKIAQYPDLAGKVAAHGHVIGNHTYTHPKNITADTSVQILQEMNKCEDIITRVTGKKPILFRSPLGLNDQRVLNAARSKGYEVVNWSICADNYAAPTPEMMAKRVIDNIEPGGIILLHDGRFQGRWKDVAATGIIVEQLVRRGYQFVTVPELLAMSEQATYLTNKYASPINGKPADGEVIAVWK